MVHSSHVRKIYELNAHECHHTVVITSEKPGSYFKPRVSELESCHRENMANAIDTASVLILFFFFYNKISYKSQSKIVFHK